MVTLNVLLGFIAGFLTAQIDNRLAYVIAMVGLALYFYGR